MDENDVTSIRIETIENGFKVQVCTRGGPPHIPPGETVVIRKCSYCWEDVEKGHDPNCPWQKAREMMEG